MAKMVKLPDGRVVRQFDPELQKKALESPAYDPNRPVINQDTMGMSDEEYQKVVDQQQADAQVRRRMASIAETPGVSLEDKRRFMDAEAKNIGMTSLDRVVEAPSLDAYRESVGAYTSQTAPTAAATAAQQPAYTIADEGMRDLQREQMMADKLGGPPTSGPETANMLKATYSPAELQAMGFSEVQAQSMAGQPLPHDPETLRAMGMNEQQIAALAQRGGEVNQAYQTAQATPKPTNSMLYKLQNALRGKAGIGQDQMSYESDLYKRLGLDTEGGGYAQFARNLNQRRNEMAQTYDNFANMVNDVGSQMQGVWEQAMQDYELTKSAYDSSVDAINKINEQARDQEFLMSKMMAQHGLDMELAEFKEKLAQETQRQYLQGLGGIYGEGQPTGQTDSAGNPIFTDEFAGKKVEASESINGILNSSITQGYDTAIDYSIPGQRPGKHDGLDYVLPGGKNADVTVPINGVIKEIKPGSQDKGWGNQVIVEDTSGRLHTFSHLDQFNPELKAGDVVSAGTPLGKQGNTGYTRGKTGIHVDYRITQDGKYIDPQQFLSSMQQAISQDPGEILARQLTGVPDTYSLAGQSVKVTGPTQEAPLIERYVLATGDDSIYNPKSSINKSLANMSEDMQRQFLEAEIAKKSGKEDDPFAKLEAAMAGAGW